MNAHAPFDAPRGYDAPAAPPASATLPMNIEAEQGLLGAILLNNEVMRQVGGILRAGHFSEELHVRIFMAAAAAIERGEVATPVTLASALGDHDLGGMSVPQYLARLAAESCGSLTAPSFARTIVDLAVRRDLIALAGRIDAQAREATLVARPASLIEAAETDLAGIRAGVGDISGTRRTVGDSAAALIERARKIAAHEIKDEGVPSGIPDLDGDTGGYQPGTLWIVAARPGMGKTIYATSSALKVAAKGTGVLLFSLEVPEIQLTARILSDMSFIHRRPIPFGRIIRGALADDEMWRLEDANRRLATMPLVLDVASRLSVSEIAARVRAEKDAMAKRGVRLGVVFIDYLKFVKASDRYKGQRVYEVGEISAGLKELAKNEDVCIVLLAQLNRALENRDRKDRRPGLSDLRESGDLEADADVVMFVHREAYYLERSPEYRAGDPVVSGEFDAIKNNAELILGKNRAGPTRTHHIWVDVSCSAIAAQQKDQRI